MEHVNYNTGFLYGIFEAHTGLNLSAPNSSAHAAGRKDARALVSNIGKIAKYTGTSVTAAGAAIELTGTELTLETAGTGIVVGAPVAVGGLAIPRMA